MSDAESAGVELPVVWGDPSELPIYAVNQFAGQFAALDEFVLTAGYVLPPIILGDDEARRRAWTELKSVEVRPIVRLSMGRVRMKELADLLNRMLERTEPNIDGETGAEDLETG